jgi:glycosyltransferase involved in cell wall biosynthesis
MKIIHINFSGRSGGAAIATGRLHTALIRNGIDSSFWCARKPARNKQSVCIKKPGWQKLDGLKNVIVQRALGWIGVGAGHSINIFPSRLVRQLNASNADVIHLHWINAEMVSIAQLAKIKKPMVWTLHDMWAFCGAEHYTTDNRYVTGYRSSEFRVQGSESSRDGQSPDNCQLPTSNCRSKIDVNRWVFRRKQKHWKNWRPHLVTPSNWLAGCARESLLFKDRSVQVVPNCLDLDLFTPADQEGCRKRFGLPLDKKLVLFGAASPSDLRKGRDLLADALGSLTMDVELVVFGAADGVPFGGMKTYWTGRIDSEQKMTALYNAADLMCVPSRQDNLPNTAVEACACGVPVVAFDIGGLSDIVEHMQTGYLAQPFDTADFARGIEWVLARRNAERRMLDAGCELLSTQHPDSDFLSANSRRKAERCFAPGVVAGQYISVYERVLAEGRLDGLKGRRL